MRRDREPQPVWRQVGSESPQHATWQFSWPGSADMVMVTRHTVRPYATTLSRSDLEHVLRGIKRLDVGRHPGTGKPLEITSS